MYNNNIKNMSRIIIHNPYIQFYKEMDKNNIPEDLTQMILSYTGDITKKCSFNKRWLKHNYRNLLYKIPNYLYEKKTVYSYKKISIKDVFYEFSNYKKDTIKKKIQKLIEDKIIYEIYEDKKIYYDLVDLL
jgi:hypothetical protein